MRERNGGQDPLRFESHLYFLRLGVRWLSEIGLIWFLVLPETGVWTAITLTLLTIAIEVLSLTDDRSSES